jgi:hypothetical protein
VIVRDQNSHARVTSSSSGSALIVVTDPDGGHPVSR